MARPDSVAVGGFYKTPADLLAPVASLLAVDREAPQAILDPCAGEGEALIALARSWFDLKGSNYRLYACEMEKTRCDALSSALRQAIPFGFNYRHEALLGDAFRIHWKSPGATVLYLNPPYDHDPDLGRLEERWLRRFAPALVLGGALVLVVPFYALAASATTLATHFEAVSCFRFPDPLFDTFKQVVLVARKRAPLLVPNELTEARVRGWAADAAAIPVLPNNGPAVLHVNGSDEMGFYPWKLADLDLAGILEEYRPWHMGTKAGRLVPMGGVLPLDPYDQLLAPRFPVAVPPKPAHIAAGIASGALSGARLEPDDPSTGLPPIIVKGVFARRFQTVDRKTNAKGQVTAEIQVEHPELRITALDLRAGTFHTLASTVDLTEGNDIASFTAGDLLQHYGGSLLATLRDRCPALYDPANETHPPQPLAEPLYTAQAHAVGAICKLLDKPDKAAILLGEIGVGKTRTTLATAAARGVRRLLIQCPPHLLDSWTEQARAVLPAARVVRLESVADVEALRGLGRGDDGETVIALLSREDAKLGHPWRSIDSRSCPACGARPHGNVWKALVGGRAKGVQTGDLAASRAVCAHQRLVPENITAHIAVRLAGILAPVAPDSETVRALVGGVAVSRMAAKRAERRRGEAPTEVGDVRRWRAAAPQVTPIVWRAVRSVLKQDANGRPQMADVLVHLLAAVADDDLTGAVARKLFAKSLEDRRPYGGGAALRSLAREVLLLLPPRGPEQTALAAEFEVEHVEDDRYAHNGPAWSRWRTHVASMAGDGVGGYEWSTYRVKGGVCHVGDHPAGSVAMILRALELIVAAARFSWSKPCREPLYQAVPEPRRVSLAHYLARRLPWWPEMIAVDEVHEYGNADSAQSRAIQQLFHLRKPTIALSGSIMNGYARSLFLLLWSLSSAFRAEFSRDDEAEFVRRYGFQRQVVEMEDKGTREKVSFGAVTDRVERVARTTGQAPGVLPALLLRHLLPISVTLQIQDLNVDLPPCSEIVEMVDPGEDLGPRYRRLERKLVEQIKKDRFSEEGLSGRLFGALSELPSYLDRATADVGNAPGGAFEIRYPEDVGGDLVDIEPGLPEDTILPKEQRMLEIARRELAEGRNVMVFAWHVDGGDPNKGLLRRLSRLLEEHTGEAAPILWANKVPPKKRQAWIQREIVDRGRRLLVCNPVAIQTGLNNLVHFSTEVWMENPACNPQIRRQAKGRVFRIGQVLPTRIYSMVYQGTAQELAHRLLMHKIAISEAADGLDAAAAMAAAGVGTPDETAGQDIGRLLYRMLEERAAA